MSLSQQQLESMLWGAAEFLRGQIDASDYKQYIFPLLFYKRLSDLKFPNFLRRRILVESNFREY